MQLFAVFKNDTGTYPETFDQFVGVCTTEPAALTECYNHMKATVDELEYLATRKPNSITCTPTSDGFIFMHCDCTVSFHFRRIQSLDS